MNKSYYSLGLMSGTSGDGVDASLAISDGKNKFDIIHNEYVQYPFDVYEEFHKLKEKILNLGDIEKYSKKLKDIERKITICNSTAVETIKFKLSQQKSGIKIDLVGFHGQTILHIPEKKFSLQLGDAKLLSQITNTSVVYKFRENDLKNGGQGAPLAPIFHQLIVNQKKIELPLTILNLGGIANVTSIDKKNKISSSDIGPGNCLIDNWIRLNSKLYYVKYKIENSSETITIATTRPETMLGDTAIAVNPRDKRYFNLFNNEFMYLSFIVLEKFKKEDSLSNIMLR